MQIAGRAERMQMIGHQQIVSHQLSRGFRPRFAEKLVGKRVCKPRNSFLGRNCEKDNI
jgi:hypothetical protein